MSNSKWSKDMNQFLTEKLSSDEKTVSIEQLESQGIVAIKNKITGKTEPVKWLTKLPTVKDFKLGNIVPIFQKEPQGLVSTD